jgi:hypothetical protein
MSTFALLSSALFLLVVLISLALYFVISLNSKGLEAASSSTSNDKISLSAYYQPMRLLLNEDELASARQLMGISAQDWKSFRQRRLRVFRHYLSDLRTDFRRMEFKLRYLMLAASREDVHLVERLNRVKLEFYLGLWALEARLLLFYFGVGSIEIGPILDRLQIMESALVPSVASPFSSVAQAS